MRLFILCALLCAPLLADKITTPEGKTFEGVVSSFDKDESLTLATGYGDLTFSVKEDVRDASTGDYPWPASKQTEKPLRSTDFEKWVKSRAPQVAAKWVAVPEKKETKELDAKAFFDLVAPACDRAKSLKFREDTVNAIVKDGKWAYVVVTVQALDKNNTGLFMTVGYKGTYDARTGKSAFNPPAKGMADNSQDLDWFCRSLSAEAALTTDDVDEKNKTARDEQAGDKMPKTGPLFLDYEHAREMIEGDALVFKVSVGGITADGDVVWVAEPVRLNPRKLPIKK